MQRIRVQTGWILAGKCKQAAPERVSNFAPGCTVPAPKFCRQCFFGDSASPLEFRRGLYWTRACVEAALDQREIKTLQDAAITVEPHPSALIVCRHEEIPQIKRHGRGVVRVVAFPISRAGTAITYCNRHDRFFPFRTAPRARIRIAQATRFAASCVLNPR